MDSRRKFPVTRADRIMMNAREHNRLESCWQQQHNEKQQFAIHNPSLQFVDRPSLQSIDRLGKLPAEPSQPVDKLSMPSSGLDLLTSEATMQQLDVVSKAIPGPFSLMLEEADCQWQHCSQAICTVTAVCHSRSIAAVCRPSFAAVDWPTRRWASWTFPAV